MVFDHTFHIAAPADMVWAIIKDIPQLLERIPGARFSGSDGTLAHNATFEIPSGPARGSYTLHIAVESLDDNSRTAVIGVTGENAAGSGGLAATFRVAVQPFGAGANIEVHADVDAPGIAASASGAPAATPRAQAFAERPGARNPPPAEFTNAANEFAANLQRMFQR